MRANGRKNDDRGKGGKPGVTCSRNDEDGGHEGSGNEEQQQPPRKKRKRAAVSASALKAARQLPPAPKSKEFINDGSDSDSA